MLEPVRDCALCPRLADFRAENRKTFPDWHNAPVASFGDDQVPLLIVGLAPGLRGANRTGRPFTGDFAGDLLYPTLLKFSFARGQYGAAADDGLRLDGCRITNALRCVPPQNKPVGAEVAACRAFLANEIGALPKLQIVLALGLIAHGAVLAALGLRKSAFEFRHGAFHPLPDGRLLANSYHCSRYNTNTGRLTVAMFNTLIGEVAERLDR